MGLSAMTSSASICSVMRMMPSSAVSAEPARPVTMRPASTGPSSRISDNATAGPKNASDPNRESGTQISDAPLDGRARRLPGGEEAQQRPRRLARQRLADPGQLGLRVALARLAPAAVRVLAPEEPAHRPLHVLVARVDADGAQPAQHRPRAVDVIDAPAAVPRPVVALRAADEVDGAVDGLEVARVAERA